MDFSARGVTINSRLRDLAEENPEKPAFIFWDKHFNRTVLTRQDVWDKSRKCAAFLRRQGVVKGDVVCNTLVNSQERLITMYGTMLAGGVSMHGQKLLADGEDIVKNLGDSQCKYILLNPYEEKGPICVLEKLQYQDADTGNIGYRDLPKLSKVVPIVYGETNGRDVNWLQTLDQEQELYVDDSVTEDDFGIIMTTSGTTGFAKVVPHTHKILVLIGISFGNLIHLKHDAVYFNKNYLGWMGGCPVNYPVTGLTRVLVDMVPGNSDKPGELYAHLLEFEKCHSGLIVAGDIELILKHMDSIKKVKLTHLLGFSGIGGGLVSTDSMRAIGRICESMTVLYGASEFGVVFGFDVTDPSTYENGCCGYPVPIVEAKIVDKDLKDVCPGTSGEVLFRGQTLFSGYMNNPDANKEVFLDDGWWRTSDVGHMNEKGQLFVYCRKSNVIIKRGYLLHPGWIEARVNKHPDIQTSIVVGIQHPIVVEEICLCVIKRPESNLTVEDVREYFNSLFLTNESDYITPSPDYYLFFDSFPCKGNNKIDRKAIKQIAMERLKGQ